jgi:hypothetical protein
MRRILRVMTVALVMAAMMAVRKGGSGEYAVPRSKTLNPPTPLSGVLAPLGRGTAPARRLVQNVRASLAHIG